MTGPVGGGPVGVGPVAGGSFPDDAPCGYLRTADDGLVLEANQTLLDGIGRTRAEVVGRLRLVDLLSGGSRMYHETHFAPLLRVRGEVQALALDLRHADGTRRPVLVNARRTSGRGGGAPTVQVVTFDASERREYERELVRAKQRAEASEARAVELSRMLQATLIPPLPPAIPGLDVAAVYRPAGAGDEVGGDFYDVVQAREHEWVLAVGDVEGKGVEAAAVASLARHVVRAASIPARSPRSCLRTLNEVLLADRTSRTLTAAVLRLARTATGWAGVSCVAGHGLPLLVRADGTAHEFGVPGTLLGVVVDPPLREQRVELVAGDVLVMCTDGVAEARPAHGGDFFGEDRVVDLVREHRRSATDITSRLLDEVVAYSQGDTRDDVAVLAVVVR